MVAQGELLANETPLALINFAKEFTEKVEKKADGSTVCIQQEIVAEKPCRISQLQTESVLRVSI